MTGNMILLYNISDDVRYSIYYLMRCLHIVYSVDINRGFMILRDKDKPDSILSADDILDMIRMSYIIVFMTFKNMDYLH